MIFEILGIGGEVFSDEIVWAQSARRRLDEAA
jgi:hypothetical protein